MKASLSKKIVITGIVILVITAGVFGIAEILKSDGVRQFQSFTVTIKNQSDYDIVSVKMGVITGSEGGGNLKETAKEFPEFTIKSGRKATLRPYLSKEGGEGGIYLDYTDSTGQTKREWVCGYTESLSGYSDITVTNKGVSSKGRCM